MDRDKMSNLHRGPSIDASYHVSVHLGNGFQRRRLKCEKLTDDRRRTPSDGKSSHCLWQGDLKTNQNKNLISPFFFLFKLNIFDMSPPYLQIILTTLMFIRGLQTRVTSEDVTTVKYCGNKSLCMIQQTNNCTNLFTCKNCSIHLHCSCHFVF